MSTVHVHAGAGAKEMDHTSAAVLSGRLLFPVSQALVNKITKKKPWTPKYCILFKASKQGIQRLEIYENEEDAAGGDCQRIITLENCIKITRGVNNTITIVTKSLTRQVSAPTEVEASEWVGALQTVAFGDDVSKQTSIDEDNDLYCSSGEGVFTVKLCPSEASKKSDLEPIKYTLCLASTAIELRNAEDNRVLTVWPYRYIRRYGYRQGKFAFEAGRKCDTGEGTFHFEHSNQQEIFRCLSMKIKSMKKMINSDSLHSLDCGDQLHAAMSMEARSRSPLPLSSRVEDFTANSISVKSSSSIHQSVDSFAPLLPAKPDAKPKPVKPPRKHIFTVAKEKHENDFADDVVEFGKYRKLDDYDRVNAARTSSAPASYDKVEVRSEAWKTLGITDIDHVEFSTENTQNACLRLISRSQENLDDIGSGESSKVIILQTPPDPEEANYDRLQHFRSSTKLNRSEGYKSVVARPLALINNNNNSVSSTKDTWSDYDEVENVMQSVRLADDSHLGYGMIRKPSVPGPQVPCKAKPACAIDCDDSSAFPNIGHCEFNGSDYAIVSKPKRV